MTHADSIAQDDIHLEPSQLWMLPILLLQMMAAIFLGHAARLKRLRRRPPRTNKWTACYWDLRLCEWSIEVVLAEGARRLLAGKPIDLDSIRIRPPPETWLPAMPRSARDMSLRFEATARFHADPHSFIRRHAARIAAQADKPTSTNAQTSRSPHEEQHAQRASVEPCGRGSPALAHIRAPPYVRGAPDSAGNAGIPGAERLRCPAVPGRAYPHSLTHAPHSHQAHLPGANRGSPAEARVYRTRRPGDPGRSLFQGERPRG